MKKLLTILLVVLFATPLFAQNATSVDANDHAVKARTMNHLLYNKRKELGKLKADRLQTPHLPQDNNIVLWSEDFDGAAPTTYQADSVVASTDDNADITTFNAYQGEGGEFSWWIGLNDPLVLGRPGYANGWNVAVYTDASYLLQADLDARSVRFDMFYNIEFGYDACYLQITSDGGTTWEDLACYTGDTGEEWIEDETVDIPEDYNGEEVSFRFLFYSDGVADGDDGLIGSLNNPGGFFFDNFELLRDNVPQLLDDGDDNITVFEVDVDVPFPVGPWAITDDMAASPDYSLGFDEYSRPLDSYFVVGDPIDLTTGGLGANFVAPLWYDFNVYSTIPFDGDPDNNYDFIYWRPVVYIPADDEFIPLTEFVYVGEFTDDGDFVNYADNYGYINLTSYYGEEIQLGFEFVVPQTCQDLEGVLYFDDLTIIQVNDPYEENDFCYDAAILEYGHITEYANTFDSLGNSDDYFVFDGEAGDWVDVYVDNSNVDMALELHSAQNDTTCGDVMMVENGCCEMESKDDGEFYDRVIWRLPVTGRYFIYTYPQPDDSVASYTLWLMKLEEDAAITDIADVPDDQGKMVRVEFEAPELDNYDAVDFSKWGAHTIGFQVERKQYVVAPGWDVVGQMDAFGLASTDYPYYTIDVPTKADSVNQTYRVRTKTGYVDYQGLYTTAGETAVGMSYDNIAPIFVDQYTLRPESGTGVDVAAEVDPGRSPIANFTDIKFYNVYRSDASGFTPSAANKIATVETEALNIRYNDAEFDGTTDYYYVVEVVDQGGNKVYSAEVNTITAVEDEAVPTKYSLSQNYPNPFNPTTSIKFGIPQAADVTVKIYDILGQEVRTLVNRNLAAGYHTVNFDATNLISGMYIYRIQANGVDGNNFTDVKKMLLVK